MVLANEKGLANLEYNLDDSEDKSAEKYDAKYKNASEALRAEAITEADHRSCLKAEMDYGMARKKFIEKYDLIKHEKVAHNSHDIEHVVKEADLALAEYEDAVAEMNSLFVSLGIKKRSELDGSLFADTDKKIALDKMIQELELGKTREKIKELPAEPNLHLIGNLEEDEENPAA